MSNYYEEQKKRAIQTRDEIFADPGEEKNPHVLKNPAKNLWDGIRKDAIDYFEKNKIAWWGGQGPTGSLVSSQIACLNHLYPLRQKEDLATLLLKGIDGRIKKAVKADDGFVEFEAIGKKGYLNEGKERSRGTKITSLDAIMVGEKGDGKNILFVFEWKYTEEVSEDTKNGDYFNETRNTRYMELLRNQKSIKTDNIKEVYRGESNYQRMRQTLLAEEMVKAGEYNCDEFIHLHVIPDANKEWKTVCDQWKQLLVNPEKYKVISPEKLFKPIENENELIAYLRKRYW